MTRRDEVEALLVELDDSNTISSDKNERAAKAIRSLLADNDYFREMPSLAVYVQALRDADALRKIRIAMAKIADAAVMLDNGMFRIEGTGEYYDVAVAEDAVNEIREALELAEARDEVAPAGVVL